VQPAFSGFRIRIEQFVDDVERLLNHKILTQFVIPFQDCKV
jgi:hypothetical protein